MIRFSPIGGIHFVFLIAARASSRKPSTDANHWEVARKIVGFFVRQSYGYLEVMMMVVVVVVEVVVVVAVVVVVVVVAAVEMGERHLCSYASSMMGAPASFSATTASSLPSPSTDLPTNRSPASEVNLPASSTGERSGRPYLSPVR